MKMMRTLLLASVALIGVTAQAGMSPKVFLDCKVQGIQSEQISLRCGDAKDTMKMKISRKVLLERDQRLKDADIRPGKSIPIVATIQELQNLMNGKAVASSKASLGGKR
jgi:hypothetical protein